MFDRMTQSPPAQGADVIARAVAALALAALAVIHVVDLPATLGPTPLVRAGYLGVIAAAARTRGGMITRAHPLWCAPGAAEPGRHRPETGAAPRPPIRAKAGGGGAPPPVVSGGWSTGIPAPARGNNPPAG